MSDISSRTFLGTTTAVGALSFKSKSANSKPLSKKRNHPLEGIEREDIKITDVKTTLLSCEIPPEEQWFVDKSKIWKRDTVLVEVFTDKGIVGIGGMSMYGGPEKIKKYTEDIIKPAILGKNPNEIEYIRGS